MTDSFVEKYEQETQPVGKKLLVIDDKQTELDEHCKAMWYLGYDVQGLLVTDEMLLGGVNRAINNFKPDAILTDWEMNSYVDGLKVGEMIKMRAEYEEIPAIPVILHTAANNQWVQKNAEEWKSEYGFQAVLRKGSHCDIDEVLSEYFKAHPEVSYDRSGRQH